ncbi:MAG: PD-(D/E)XK nuclease family protein [Gammaproteobacteria bacterium]|nr:PD-(D/E)XK nuclease family protein [Gammaproteobacteria bacterium]
MSITRLHLNERLAEAIEQGATVLVPNNRLRDAVVRSYARSQSHTVFVTPRVIGVDVWARNTWDQLASLGRLPYCTRLLVSDTEERVLWTQIIENSLHSYPLLNPGETAAQASRAYQRMKQWKLQKNHQQELLSFAVIPDLQAFLHWSTMFEKLCKKKSVISLVDCIEQICMDLASPNTLPIANNFVLLNFTQPPPLYRTLFEYLKNVAAVEEIKPDRQDPTISGQSRIFPTVRDEFTAAASWAKQIMANDSQAHIGLIGQLSDEQHNELERILRNALRPQYLVEYCSEDVVFNSSRRSSSLMDEALIHDAFLIFDLVIKSREAQLESFCRLLRSPYVLPNTGEHTQRTRLEQHLRRRLTNPCRGDDLVYFAGLRNTDYRCPKLMAAIRAVQRKINVLTCSSGMNKQPASATPAQWSKFLTEVLRRFGWPGRKLTPHQKRVVITRFEAALTELSGLTPILERVDFSQVLSRLRQICLDTKLKPKFDDRCQISLLSLEEASDLAFDHLWILNFNDQVWPPPVSPTPFLPYPLQRELGMPGSHSNIQVMFARDIFSSLLVSASKTFTVSHHRSGDDQEFRPSSFSAEFTNLALEIESDSSLVLPMFNSKENSHLQLIAIPDDDAVPLQPRSGDESLGGVNVLNDQSRCPFHAFIQHRLRAEPLESFASGLSPAAKGTAIHLALEKLYAQITERNDLSVDPDSLWELCNEAAAEAVRYLRQHHRSIMTKRFTQIEKRRIATRLSSFLQIEKEREKFSVLCTEEKMSWHYRDMLFNLKIDRIDRLADNTIAVIDYKTGRTAVSSSNWLKERPEDLQLPMYMTVIEETGKHGGTVSAVAVARINIENPGYSGITDQEPFHPTLTSLNSLITKHPEVTGWPELQAKLKDGLERIADEFLAGIATITPPDYARNCTNRQIRAMCRLPDATIKKVSPQKRNPL